MLVFEIQLCSSDVEVCISGLPAQIIQAYPGQATLTQQQQKSLDAETGQAAEEHAAFASLAESGKQASAAQNASEVRQQVLADVATLPRAPVEQGGQPQFPSCPEALLVACAGHRDRQFAISAKQGFSEASLKLLGVAQEVQPCPCACRPGGSCSSSSSPCST